MGYNQAQSFDFLLNVLRSDSPWKLAVIQIPLSGRTFDRSTYVALDLETTGLDAEKDAIIEIGCVRFDDGKILDRWQSLVNPGRPIPPAITQLTGISSPEVAAAPRMADLIGPLHHFVGDSPIVAHNIGFDLGFLRAAGVELSRPTIDTFELATILLPGQASYSLGALARHFAIELEDAHRAQEDAEATARLFMALQEQAAALPLAVLAEINRLALSSTWSLRPFFVEAETRASRSQSLPAGQRQALERGELSPLLHGSIARRPRFEEELLPLDQPAPIDVEGLAEILEPGGPVAARFPGYEHREPQVEMLRAVAAAFNNADHLLIEAGTGTGKSLAYLLPAIAWAIQNRRRVVISTNTINLQDQLVAKDIPDLQAIFAALLAHDPRPATDDDWFIRFARQASQVRVAVMKGRSNYLCPRRLNALRGRAGLSEEELRVLARVLVWLPNTTSGDQGELFLQGNQDYAVWARLAAESGACTAERCERVMGGRCFFYRNRRQAEAAHIIVVNHALLLSDVAAENRVLPEYRHLIVDEAHHLEDATTGQLSFQATQEGLERLLSGVYPEAGQGQSGLLHDLRQRNEAGLPPEMQHRLAQLSREAQRLVETGRAELRAFFALLGRVLEPEQPNASAYSQRIRLESGLRGQPGWSEVEIAWDEAAAPLFGLIEALERLQGGLSELEQAGIEGLDDLIADFSSLAAQLGEAYEQINSAIVDPDPGAIYWAEIAAGNGRLSLHAAPLHVGPLVETHLFHQKDNVIMTSATLRTAGSYEYIVERLHAYEARIATVGSPFDYKSSTLVYVPTDLDQPNGPRFQGQVNAAIRELAKALHGRTLALFTAYNQLRQTAEAISRELAAAGIAVYQQGGGGSRRQLLDNFRGGQPAVLLGTRSFWEGVDVVGEALSGLVITRLPFAVPSDPVVAARAETFDNPFYQYSVPDAILKFRQGFGRLIRSRSDRGVCVIMDNRVLTKNYGRLFLESLPNCTIQRGPLALMAKAARDWLARQD